MKPKSDAAVKSANRALDILEYVADAAEPPTFSRLLADLHVPRSSLFHLLNNLILLCIFVSFLFLVFLRVNIIIFSGI